MVKKEVVRAVEDSIIQGATAGRLKTKVSEQIKINAYLYELGYTMCDRSPRSS